MSLELEGSELKKIFRFLRGVKAYGTGRGCTFVKALNFGDSWPSHAPESAVPPSVFLTFASVSFDSAHG